MSDPDETFYLKKIRETQPKVHCLTNSVVQNLTANMLLSISAHPSMSADISEVEDFTASAQALLVNLGTLDAPRKAATLAAIKTANALNIPWILDPVLVNRASMRLGFAKELLALHPAAIRGNRDEILSLDVDIKTLSQKTGAVVAVTGADDIITDGTSSVTITTGHPIMAHVTGMGCSGTAMLAAFVAVGDDHFKASCAALRLFGQVGEKIGIKASGPSQFQINFLDELYQTSQKVDL